MYSYIKFCVAPDPIEHLCAMCREPGNRHIVLLDKCQGILYDSIISPINIKCEKHSISPRLIIFRIDISN